MKRFECIKINSTTYRMITAKNMEEAVKVFFPTLDARFFPGIKEVEIGNSQGTYVVKEIR